MIPLPELAQCRGKAAGLQSIPPHTASPQALLNESSSVLQHGKHPIRPSWTNLACPAIEYFGNKCIHTLECVREALAL